MVPQIKRAFLIFHSGQKVYVRPFSWDSHGDIVEEYMANLNAFSEHHWMSLLHACGVLEEKVDECSNAPSLESTRHTLYIPSSP